MVDILEDKVVETIHASNYLTFAGIKSDEIPHSCGTSYFYYKFAKHLSDIKSSINPKTQTITLLIRVYPKIKCTQLFGYFRYRNGG